MSLRRKTIPILAVLCIVYTSLFIALQITVENDEYQNNATPLLLTWEDDTDSVDEEDSLIRTVSRDSTSTDREMPFPLGKRPSAVARKTQIAPHEMGSESLPTRMSHYDVNEHLSDEQVGRDKNDPNLNPDIRMFRLRKLKESIQQTQNGHTKTLPKSSKPLPMEDEVIFLKLTPSFYIYGAVVDNRRNSTKIRVFVLRSNLKEDSEFDVMCVFNVTSETDTNSDTYQRRPSTLHIPAVEYEMCENHDKKFGGWIYSCALPNDVDPAQMRTVCATLVGSQSGITLGNATDITLQQVNRSVGDLQKEESNETKNGIPLENQHPPGNTYKSYNPPFHLPSSSPQRYANTNSPRSKPSPLFKIGLCVPPLYGNVDLQRIVNFVEFCRILGASRVFLYISDISMEMLELLQEYSRMDKSILSLVNWNLPILETRLKKSNRGESSSASSSSPSDQSYTIPPSQVIWNRGQLLSIQHCLYTNMHSFDWMLFLDIDEMLVPKSSLSWQSLIPDLLKKLPEQASIKNSNKLNRTSMDNYERSKHLAAFSFESAIFYTDFESQARYSMDYFQKLRRDTKTDSTRRKVLVRGSKIFELGIHHVSRPMSETDFTHKVGASTALIHHYRPGGDPSTLPELVGEGTQYDDSVLRFHHPLSKATKLAMNYLGSVMSRHSQ